MMNIRRKPFIIIIVTAAVTAIAGYGLYNWSQQPASLSAADLQAQNSAAATTAAAKEADNEPGGSGSEAGSSSDVWKTAFFSSLMPSDLELRSSREDDRAAVIGSYSLGATAGRTGQLAVSIGNLNGALTDITAIRLRLSQPAEYVASNRTYAPAGALVFNRTSSYETDIFWQHDGRYVSLAASGSALRKTELENDLKLIAQHWQWL